MMFQASATLLSRVSAERILQGTMLLAFILLPFSTGAGNNTVVVSYGLPFLLLASFVALLTLTSASHGFSLELKWPILITSAFILSISYTVVFSREPIPSVARIVPNIASFLVFLSLLLQARHSPETVDRCLLWLGRAMVISGVVLALYYSSTVIGNIQKQGIITVLSDRTTGGPMAIPWGATNVVAAAMILPIIAALFMVSFDVVRARMYKIGMALMLFALIITLSRTALIVVAMLFTVNAILSKRIGHVVALLLVLAIALGSLYVIDPDAAESLLMRRVDDDVAGLGGRDEVWDAAVSHIATHPLEPIGYYGANQSFVSPHNLFMTKFIEEGVVGVCCAVLLFLNAVYWLIRLLRSTRKATRGGVIVLLAGIIGIFVNQQFEDPQFTQQYTVYFWMFMALVYLVRYASGESRAKIRGS